MKKFLKIIGVILAIFIAYCVIAMLFFDSKCHNEQSLVINAPKEKVWQNVNSMKAFNQWNPWLKLDPNMKMEYFGTSGQVRDSYSWDSKIDDAGAGKQVFTKVYPVKYLTETEITFFRPFESTAKSAVYLNQEASGTKVTWTMDTEMNYPMNLMKLFMDSQMEKSYGEGLENLKRISER